MVASDTSTTEVRLPGFFPRAPKDCLKPAQAFFDCFSNAAIKKDESDIEAGVVGYNSCKYELKYYEKCMQKGYVVKKTESKLFRVQDEYRKGGESTK